MDCATIIDWISTIRAILFVGPIILGLIAGFFANGPASSFFGGISGGFIGYILNIISKLPVIEKFLINILSLAFRVGECP